MRLKLRLLLAGGVLTAAGCGRSGYSPAEGVVTLDGNPLPNATVMFQAPRKPLATAQTNEEGRYRVETGGANGIKPGEYSVTIAAYKDPKDPGGARAPDLAIPRKYLDAESSGLKAVIGEGTNRDINFNLTAN